MAWAYLHFAGRLRQTAAALASITSTCRRHEINPEFYLTSRRKPGLANLPSTRITQVGQWLPDVWKRRPLAGNQSSPAPTAG
jgi:hypothetical protein